MGTVRQTDRRTDMLDCGDAIASKNDFRHRSGLQVVSRVMHGVHRVADVLMVCEGLFIAQMMSARLHYLYFAIYQ